MDMIQSLIRSLAPTLPPVVHQNSGIRSFTAAAQDNLTAGWSTTDDGINNDLYKQLNVLRNRSRDLAKNNDYSRKYLSLIKTNVVGNTGITLQVKAQRPDGSIDERDSNVLEKAFSDWSKKQHCDVRGQLSWLEIQNLVIETIAKDGECLIRKTSTGKYRFQLQLIDAAKLDSTYNLDQGSTHIRMGIELDQFNRPVAYHLIVQDDLLGYVHAGRRYQRVPADQIEHLFLTENIEQLRGIPWMTSAMARLKMLDGYEEAALVASRNAASRLGFFTSADATPPPLHDGEEADGEKFTTTAPGTYDTLPDGFDFKPFESEYPHKNHGDFIKTTLRGISAGWGVPYHSLANDLEGVNFSSIRSGTLEEREYWKVLQAFLIEKLCTPVYSQWLSNTLDFTDLLPLPANKIEKFDAATWQARRWAWVDPLKDIRAMVTAKDEKLKSPQNIIREMGLDPETVWAEIEQYEQRFPQPTEEADNAS